MNKLTITLNGTAFPAYSTAGALVLYQQEQGRETVTNTVDAIKFLYCCVKAACHRENKAFDMDFFDFSCQITPDEVQEWQTQMAEAVAGASDGSKKKARR